MRVLLADTQPKVRSALKLLLQEQPGVEVVGEVSNLGALHASIEQRQPDIILLEWGLPHEDPAVLIAWLRWRYPDMRLVVLGNRRDLEQEALAAGATAFISKAETPDRLMGTLDAVFEMGNRRSVGR